MLTYNSKGAQLLRAGIERMLERQGAELEREYQEAGKALKAIPGVGSWEFGLTPDAVKFSPEYRAAKRRMDVAFQTLRAFNAEKVKRVKQLKSL